MKICIVELMPNWHYTLVDAFARIFIADPNNQVYIFTYHYAEEELQPLVREGDGRIHLVLKGPDESLESYIEKINSHNADKIYIPTLEKYFNEFNLMSVKAPIHLYIHNIDDWFFLKWKQKFYHIFTKIFTPREFIYSIKTNILYPIGRKKFADKVLKSGGKFIVATKFLKQELSKAIPEKKIEVIPFSLFRKEIKDQSENNTRLRICSPGFVSALRRDYYSLFKIIESDLDFFRDKIELDLLGGINSNEDCANVVIAAKKLISKGVRIHLYEIPKVKLFDCDEQLAKADFILGNINVFLNKYNIYGKTKETGITFTMARAAKPGILTADYLLIDELKTSSLIFKDYEGLKSILKELILNPDKVKKLKEEAKKNVYSFTPEYLLKSLS